MCWGRDFHLQVCPFNMEICVFPYPMVSSHVTSISFSMTHIRCGQYGIDAWPKSLKARKHVLCKLVSGMVLQVVTYVPLMKGNHSGPGVFSCVYLVHSTGIRYAFYTSTLEWSSTSLLLLASMHLIPFGTTRL